MKLHSSRSRMFVLALLLLASPMAIAQQKSTPDVSLVYVYDALCGWCYGFSPVMDKVHRKYRNSMDFRVVSGGLVTGARIGPIGEVLPFPKEDYKQLEERTGVEFGEEFLRVLDEGTETFTSVPAAIAMSVFKLYAPDKVIEYASAIQNAIYWEGMPTEPFEGYALIASTFGIDEAAFGKKMRMDMIQQQAYADFTIAADLDVTAFPAVFIQHGNDLYRIASGYVTYEDLVASIERVLTQLGQEGASDTWQEER